METAWGMHVRATPRLAQSERISARKTTLSVLSFFPSELQKWVIRCKIRIDCCTLQGLSHSTGPLTKTGITEALEALGYGALNVVSVHWVFLQMNAAAFTTLLMLKLNSPNSLIQWVLLVLKAYDTGVHGMIGL